MLRRTVREPRTEQSWNVELERDRKMCKKSAKVEAGREKGVSRRSRVCVVGVVLCPLLWD